MSAEESFRDKTFQIADPDTRIRIGRDDLLHALRYGPGEPLPAGARVGDYKLIPVGTEVRVTDVVAIEAPDETRRVFARAVRADGQEIGWTSTRNFRGGFRNETLGIVRPEPGARQFGPNAAWSHGDYRGQIELVSIVSSQFKVRRIAAATLAPYLELAAAAAGAGLALYLNSGFRTYAEQKALYDIFLRNGHPTTAKPGLSRHQNGIAFDVDVSGEDRLYDWLRRHAVAHGFFRTVTGEPWHWEYDPATASRLAAAGAYRTPNVTDA